MLCSSKPDENENRIIHVGDKASVTRIIDKKMIEHFVYTSMDDNPIHVDEEYAKTTRFKRPIVQGFLTAGYVVFDSGHLNMQIM